MIISIDAWKVFEKNSTPTYDISPESKHKRNIPQHNKSHIWETHSKQYLQWWKIESISSKIRKKTRVLTLPTTIQHFFGSLSHNSQRRKINEKESRLVKKKKKEWKLSLFTDDIILYIESPRDTMRILLESIIEYYNIVGYKLLHRSPLHCYIWTMRKQRGKLRKQSYAPLQRK